MKTELPDTGASHNAHMLDGQYMLQICIVPECTTIVFGTGTCIDHDRPRLTVTRVDDISEAEAA